MAQEIPCVGCGRTDRPITIWKGTDVCCENCRKLRDGEAGNLVPPARCICGDQPPGSIRACPIHSAEASHFRTSPGSGPVGGVLGTPFWIVQIESLRPVNHTPCWAGVNEITTLGDEVEWFECAKCGATKSGNRIGHEAGEH